MKKKTNIRIMLTAVPNVMSRLKKNNNIRIMLTAVPNVMSRHCAS